MYITLKKGMAMLAIPLLALLMAVEPALAAPPRAIPATTLPRQLPVFQQGAGVTTVDWRPYRHRRDYRGNREYRRSYRPPHYTGGFHHSRPQLDPRWRYGSFRRYYGDYDRYPRYNNRYRW